MKNLLRKQMEEPVMEDIEIPAPTVRRLKDGILLKQKNQYGTWTEICVLDKDLPALLKELAKNTPKMADN